MAEPARAPTRPSSSPPSANPARTARKPASPPPVTMSLPVASAGAPLAGQVAGPISASLGVDVSPIRLHSDSTSATASSALGARAFTVGNHIFLGARERATDLPLIAHEVAHVVQQQHAPRVQLWGLAGSDGFEREAHGAAAAVAARRPFSVIERTPPRVQRLGISDALDYFADKANLIPGFRMFTIILGVNPINMSRVERSAANILRAVIEFLPGGALITQALDKYGVFEKVGAWVEQQINTLGLTWSAIKAAINEFLDSLGWRDIFHLGDVWDRAKRIFTVPIQRIKDFGVRLVEGIIKFVKDAILMPLARLAEGTRGWDLLTAVLGKNPITGEPVPRNADTLIGGFLKLIGQQEIWDNIKRAGALGRAWAWFQSAMKSLLGFVTQIPTLVITAFRSLELTDIIVLPRAFAKVAAVFGNFIGNFISWAGNAMWSLLEIIFDVVSPTALGYIKRTGGALRSILRNPLPFMGNLVRAAKQGFLNFAANFLEHLRSGLIEWLTGSLPGVYIPKAFTLGEIVKFVFSVLGISWQNVRAKLVRLIPEPVVRVLETTFDIVVRLVTEGPAAAWEQIKESLSGFTDMVIGGITDFVVDTVVTKAIPQLISLFIPGAGFITAIIKIYDTVMVFVQKISRIIQVVTAFIDSIVRIAAGDIAAAANKVESVLAGLLSLAINFLAGFAGLGRVADKVMGVLRRVQAIVDKALDKLVDWIVATARRLGRLVAGRRDAGPNAAREPASPSNRLGRGIAAVQQLMHAPGANAEVVTAQLPGIQRQFALASLMLVRDRRGRYHPEATVNPSLRGSPGTLFTPAELAEIANVGRRWAAQIKSKGEKAIYQADRVAYLTGARPRVSVGELVEAAGIQEVAAYAPSLVVIRNPALQLVDASGANIGGRQAELDFLVLGTATGVDVVSAKFKPRQFRPAVDRRLLNHYLAMPLDAAGMIAYANTHFGINRAYANIASAKVVYAGGSQPLAGFRAANLSKVVVASVNVVPLTPGPSSPTGIQMVATETDLISEVVKVIDANI